MFVVHIFYKRGKTEKLSGAEHLSARWSLCVTLQFEAFPSSSPLRDSRVQSAPTSRLDSDSPVDDSQLILMNLIVSHTPSSVLLLIYIEKTCWSVINLYMKMNTSVCFKNQNRQ